MDNGNLIKDIFEKIKLWWINLFKKKKQISNKKEQIKLKEQQQTKKKYNIKLNINNENKESSLGSMYPKLNQKNKLLLTKKTNDLKRKIISLDIENNDININTIDNIIKTINNNDIYINQAIEINSLLNEINNDNELNLNTNDKLNILKDNISTIIDKKLNDYETSIIKKAYSEYDNVNYVIMTTLLIDDIIEEINELTDDFKKNKYSKAEYERKINKIKNKIDKLETINNRKEVREEIENLKKDFYTKKKDKYDLLYNEEIFINLNNKCDELLIIINNKEKEQQHIKKVVETKIEEKKQEGKKIKEQKKNEKEQKKKEELELNEKILKRFIDLEFAHKLLLLRESNRKKLTSKEEIINETIKYYNDFLLEEHQTFNFERNKIKLEVAKLYNDINNTICIIEKKEFIPLEHINIKLDALTEATLENQTILNSLIEKKHGYNMDNNENSKMVTNKLTNILNNENKKENIKENNKVLKKEFINKPTKENSPQKTI